MADATDISWMRVALEQAQLAKELGEVPVGAIVVTGQTLVGKGHNQPIRNYDSTAHAEIMAIRDAGQTLQNYRLPETTLYVTLEPCVMCAGAIMHSRISRVVYGASDPKTGCVHSVVPIFDEKRLNHHTQVEGGVLEQECATMLTNFFKERRQKDD